MSKRPSWRDAADEDERPPAAKKKPAWQMDDSEEEGEVRDTQAPSKPAQQPGVDRLPVEKKPPPAKKKPAWQMEESDEEADGGDEQASSRPAQPSVTDRLLAEAAAFAARTAAASAETATDQGGEAQTGEAEPADASSEEREAALRKQLIASQKVEMAPRDGDTAPACSHAESPARVPAHLQRSPARETNSLEDIGSRTVDCFEKESKLGEGQYGAVYKARDKVTGEFVALKKVKMEREREGFPITSLREMNILSAIDHPYIVGVKEIVVGTDLNSIFMVMEISNHDLKSVLEKQKQPFSLAEVKTLMLQLLSGVEHLHDNWVLHRDLKTSNLLYERGVLKICDFGLARPYGSPLKDYTVPVVTLYYRSIELLLGATSYSTPVDMWSVGCIFGELLLRRPLLMGSGEIDQVDKICKLLGSPTVEQWPGLVDMPDAKLVGKKLSSKNKLHTQFQVGGSSWQSTGEKPSLGESGLHLMNELLTHDPEKRLDAAGALKHRWFSEAPSPQNPEWMPIY